MKTLIVGLILQSLCLLLSAPVRADSLESHARMIMMPDRVGLAADIITPAVSGRYPTILVMTRYGRATRMSASTTQALVSAGFAVALVDMRGSGASEGHVLVAFSHAERSDISALLEWISKQAWSNGRIITTGTSYDGNLAALAIATGSKALAAVVPRFIDFGTYRDLAIPGGVRNEMLLRGWGALTTTIDHGLPCLISASNCAAFDYLKPVDGDADYQLLRRALLEHQKNWDAYRDTKGYAFEDDVTPSGQMIREGFLSSHSAALAKAQVPVQIWGSWFDARTADSALQWYALAPKAPIEVYLGAWTHGGGERVDPFLGGTAESEAGAPLPVQVIPAFISKALANPSGIERGIHYYTAGTGIWRLTKSWPPSNISTARWYLHKGNALGKAADLPAEGADHYKADFTATTGETNRWTTQLGGGLVDYGDRRAEDLKLLTYTSAPLAHAIEVTGAPVLTLHLASTHPDGAVFVYFEAIQPDGKVVYLSEGELRLPLRTGSSTANHPLGVEPSFLRTDALYLQPGQVIEIGIKLTTVSAMLPKGTRLRIAVAGADLGTFARYPAKGDPTLTIFRSSVLPSYIDIPQADWAATNPAGYTVSGGVHSRPVLR